MLQNHQAEVHLNQMKILYEHRFLRLGIDGQEASVPDKMTGRGPATP